MPNEPGNFFKNRAAGWLSGEKWAQKKQETLLLISCSLCRPPAAVI
jgi:hypothetical protein